MFVFLKIKGKEQVIKRRLPVEKGNRVEGTGEKARLM